MRLRWGGGGHGSEMFGGCRVVPGHCIRMYSLRVYIPFSNCSTLVKTFEFASERGGAHERASERGGAHEHREETG